MGATPTRRPERIHPHPAHFRGRMKPTCTTTTSWKTAPQLSDRLVSGPRRRDPHSPHPGADSGARGVLFGFASEPHQRGATRTLPESPKEDKSMESSFLGKMSGCVSSMTDSFLEALYVVSPSQRKATAKCKPISLFLKKKKLLYFRIRYVPLPPLPSKYLPRRSPGPGPLHVEWGHRHVTGGQGRVEHWASRFSSA